MATTCFSSVRGRVLRATKLDQCGNPVSGAGGTLTTAGFISVAFSNEIDEGEEITVKNAAGDLCISEPGCPIIKWVNVEATFCQVDPDLINMMTGWPKVLDSEADVVGFRTQTTIECAAGVALELWSNVNQGACVEGDVQYVYFLAPWVTQFILGDFTIENDAASFVLTGKAVAGSPWDTGPYNVNNTPAVDPEDPDVPAPLISAIGADDLMDIHLTTLAPPTPACGATSLTPV